MDFRLLTEVVGERSTFCEGKAQALLEGVEVRMLV